MTAGAGWSYVDFEATHALDLLGVDVDPSITGASAVHVR